MSKKRRCPSPSPPKKKRRVAKRIRDLYPNKTDEEIRAIKQEERKESNRRSAQKSRENQKREMRQLNQLKEFYEKRVREMEDDIRRRQPSFLRRTQMPIEEFWVRHGKEAIQMLEPPSPDIYHEGDKHAQIFLSMDPFEYTDPFGEDPVEPMKYSDDEDVEIDYDFENMNVHLNRDEIVQLDSSVQARLAFSLYTYRSAAKLHEQAKRKAALQGMIGLSSANSVQVPFELPPQISQWVANGFSCTPNIKVEERKHRDISPQISSDTDEETLV